MSEADSGIFDHLLKELTEPLNFSVMGPLEVRQRGEDLTPKAPMQARLLSLLLLNANRVVPFRTAVDELWECPPKLARKTVQTYVYQLRSALGPLNEVTGGQLIETHPGGYCLRLAEHQLDLWRFDRLVHDAQGARELGEDLRSSALLREALSLWRGFPLGNLDFGPALSAQLDLLEERRIAVLEDRIEADLRLGRHRSLTAELRSLVAQHPIREGFSGQLMDAARRSGNPGMALDAYRELHRNLVGQLGIEPSPRLRQMQRDILNAAPVTIEPPTVRATPQSKPSPGQLPPDIADFTGRAAQLAEIERVCRSPAAGGATKVVAITGQPGSGKSALAIHAAHLLKNRFPDGQLVTVLRDPEGGALRPKDVLAHLLTSLGYPEADLPADEYPRSALLRSVTADRRLLVILDDAESAEQVASLIPGSPSSAVIITSQRRPAGLATHATIELGPMDRTDCLELLARVAGRERIAAEPAAAAEVAELCDRLPLAVRIAGEKLISRQFWTVRKLADRLFDQHRRHAELSIGRFDVRTRLDLAGRRLPARYQGALQQLCRAFPGWFDLEAAARTLGLGRLAAEGPVGALTENHLLQVQTRGGRQTVHFRFPELVRLHFAQPPTGDLRAE